MRFAPRERRDDLALMVAVRARLRDVLSVSDPGVAAAKLGWWREELGRSFGGAPTHPLTRGLAAVAARHELPRAPFDRMADAVAAELAGLSPPDFAGLAARAELDLGALFELFVRVAGTHESQARRVGVPPAAKARKRDGEKVRQASEPLAGLSERLARARRLGAYTGLVAAVRDSGRQLRRGRLGTLIPADRAGAAGLAPADLAAGRAAARTALPALLADLAAELPGLRGDHRDLAELPATLRIRVRIADRLLAELEAARFDLADRRLALTPLLKLWIAWGESRRRP